MRVAIVGASGYSGAELLQIIANHPACRVVGLFASGKGEKAGAAPPTMASLFGRFRGGLDMPVLTASPDAILACQPDAVFLCTPHEASLALAGSLVDRCGCVLDLSAAFRLKDANAYPAFYGFTHDRPDLLARAIYGIVELTEPARLRGATLVAVPGCYPTSAILPLAPLVRAGALRTEADGTHRRPIIDATSGVSGAGRKAEQRLLFCEVGQQAYGVLSHRHQPEIDAYAGCATVFTPHLGPYERGILSTIHADLASGWSAQRVRDTLAQAYAGRPFVRLCPAGVWPSVLDVRGSNCCDIALAMDERHAHLIITSAIDNLVKGAAGQAVQCMNVRFGLHEATGLLPRAVLEQAGTTHGGSHA